MIDVNRYLKLRKGSNFENSSFWILGWEKRKKKKKKKKEAKLGPKRVPKNLFLTLSLSSYNFVLNGKTGVHPLSSFNGLDSLSSTLTHTFLLFLPFHISFPHSLSLSMLLPLLLQPLVHTLFFCFLHLFPLFLHTLFVSSFSSSSFFFW